MRLYLGRLVWLVSATYGFDRSCPGRAPTCSLAHSGPRRATCGFARSRPDLATCGLGRSTACGFATRSTDRLFTGLATCGRPAGLATCGPGHARPAR